MRRQNVTRQRKLAHDGRRRSRARHSIHRTMTIRTSVGLLLLLGAVGCESANIPRAPEVGAMVPQYAALTMAGDSISLSEHEGEVVLLNVWATW